MRKRIVEIISTILLLAVVVIPSHLALANGESWLTNWSYRKSITLTGTAAGAQTNYPMKITVYAGSGTDNTTSVFLGGHGSNTDFSDVRFTNSTGNVTLPYWQESVVTSTSAVFWISFDSIPASPSTYTGYIYYGNSSASSTSSGVNTFTFFDDFSGDLSKWTTSSNVSIVGGAMVVKLGTGDSATYSKTTYGTNYAARALVKSIHYNNTSYVEAFNIMSPTTYYGTGTFYCHSSGSLNTKDGLYAGSWTTSTMGGWSSGTYHIQDVIRNASTNAQFLVDNANTVTISTGIPTGAYPVLVQAAGTSGTEVDVDWVLVRKYISAEPTWTSFGAEESSPIVTTTTPETNIRDSTVTAGGNITSTGNNTVTQKGICYSTVNNPPTTADSKVSETGSYGTGAFTENLTGLSINTLYYFRAYAINAIGTGYGTASSFTTLNSSGSSSATGFVIVGGIEASSNYTTGLTAFSITNNGNCAVDIAISGTDATGGVTWTLADDGNAGTNIYGMKVGLSGGSYNVVVKKTAPYNTFVSNLAIGSSQQFGLQFFSPTNIADGVTKQGMVNTIVFEH